MNKILILTLTFILSFGVELPIEKAKLRSFHKKVALNGKIIQLSNSTENITSLVEGHLERYFVLPGERIKKGQKIAELSSIVISKMTSEYIASKEQLQSSKKNYEATKRLYDKGLTSLSELNKEKIAYENYLAKLKSIESQLNTLGVDANSLTKTTSKLILHSHSSGIISKLLKPLHSTVGQNEPIISITKERAFYLKTYIPLEFATKVKKGDKASIVYNGKIIPTHIEQILPKVDETTQRIIALSSIKDDIKGLFIDAYVEVNLYYDEPKKYVSVKKSALNFFNGEWVVFVKENGDSDGDSDSDEKVPYSFKVVKIITSDDDYVAVEGLEEGEEYISKNGYYIKSYLLKSQIGDED